MMNIKTRLILIVALLGISAVVLAVALMQRGGTPAPATDRTATGDTTLPSHETATHASASTTATTTPPDSATVKLVVSPTPLSSPMPSFKPRPTTMVSHHPTELPHTYFDLTLILKATTTDMKVGDTVTVTLIVTNTGILPAHNTYCNLAGYPYAGSPVYQPFDDPVLEPAVLIFDFDGINPGEVQTCTFVLLAARPGTVWLEGTYAGQVSFSDYDQYKGEKAPLLEIHVESGNP